MTSRRLGLGALCVGLVATALAVVSAGRVPGTGPKDLVSFRLATQPFFPIGIAGAPLDLLGGAADDQPNFDRMLAEVAGAGFNVFYPIFLTSELQNTSHDAVLDFVPDTCESRRQSSRSGIAALKRHRLAVFLPLFIMVEGTEDLLKDSSLDERFARARLLAVRRCYDGVPIFGYQSYDDAPVYGGQGIPLRKLRQLKGFAADARTGATPYVLLIHPAPETVAYIQDQALRQFIGDQLRSKLADYIAPDLADGIGVYSYPVPFASPATVGAQVARYAAMQPGVLRPLVVLQGLGIADTGQNPAGRRPTAEETRFMAFHAVVRGAGGIAWWGSNFIPSSSNLWHAIKATAAELQRSSAWLVGRDSPLTVTAAGIDALIKEPTTVGGRHLLIAVNPSPAPRTVELGVEPATPIMGAWDTSMRRAVPVTRGRFTHRFGGWGVGVFEVRLAGTPSSRPAPGSDGAERAVSRATSPGSR